MEIIIVLIILLVCFGFAIKYRYEIARYLKLRNVSPEVDDEEREIELTRTIEDCQRKLRRLKEKSGND